MTNINEFKELEIGAISDDMDLDLMGVCPSCRDKDYGDHCVLNSVDKCFEVPSLTIRLGKKNSYVVQCTSCHSVYDTGSDTILLKSEIDECNKLWEKMCDA